MKLTVTSSDLEAIITTSTKSFEGATCEIYQDGVWAGDGFWNGDEIEDCAAALPDEDYAALDLAIACAIAAALKKVHSKHLCAIPGCWWCAWPSYMDGAQYDRHTVNK